MLGFGEHSIKKDINKWKDKDQKRLKHFKGKTLNENTEE